MSLPTVTVPIISYNQAEFIQASVLSAVEQDYENLQVVVWDDDSTDGTQDILKELAAKYPERLTLRFNPHNLGGSKNRMQSLARAQGDLICYLDGDDIFLPGKIQIQVERMRARPDYAFSYHNVEVVDSITGDKLYDWKDRFGHGDGDVRKMIQYGNYCNSLSIMFRKKDLPAVTYFEDIKLGQDWFFFVNVLINGGGKFFYIDEVLARHHRHGHNRTLLWNEKLDSKLVTLDLIDQQYPQFRSEVRAKRSEVYLNKMVILIARQEYKHAFQDLFKSMKFAFPFIWKMLRLPLREISYFIKAKGKLDEMQKSLFNRS
jgi:glycosyltransferase involved in cell wall biosynthesis